MYPRRPTAYRSGTQASGTSILTCPRTTTAQRKDQPPRLTQGIKRRRPEETGTAPISIPRVGAGHVALLLNGSRDANPAGHLRRSRGLGNGPCSPSAATVTLLTNSHDIPAAHSVHAPRLLSWWGPSRATHFEQLAARRAERKSSQNHRGQRPTGLLTPLFERASPTCPPLIAPNSSLVFSNPTLKPQFRGSLESSRNYSDLAA